MHPFALGLALLLVAQDPASTAPSRPAGAAPTSAPADQLEVAPTSAPDAELADAHVDERRYRACLAQVREGQLAAARQCFARLDAEATDARERLRGETGTAVLDRLPAAAVASATAIHAPPGAPWIPAGRLELTSTAGIFGAWQGTALGIIANTVLKPGDSTSILVVGGSAVASGIGMGVGGYLLANALELDEADSLLTASGLFWGTVVGVNMLPVLNDIGANLDNLTADDLLRAYLSTVLLFGWAGGGTALALRSVLDITPGHVSMMNSGGWIGSLIGLTAMAAVLATPGSMPSMAALAYSSGAGLGLVIGAGVGALDWFERGEVLVGDLGGVLGGIALGSVALATLAGGLRFASDAQSILYAGGITSTGAVLGFAGTLALVHLLRETQATPALARRLERAVPDLAVVPTLVADGRGAAGPGLLLAGRF